MHDPQDGRRLEPKALETEGVEHWIPRMGLSSLRLMEAAADLKSSGPKVSLSNRAEPLIQALEDEHNKSWEQVAIQEKEQYDSTTALLGDILENQSLLIAQDLKKTAEKRHKTNSAVGKAISEETSAAMKHLLALVVEQESLVERLRDNRNVSVRLEEEFLSEVQSIRDLNKEKLDKLLEDYIQRADTLEDDIESLANHKTLQKDFTTFLYRNIDVGIAAPKGKTRSSKKVAKAP